MKKGVHPAWYPNAVITCSCGNTFTTGSTQATLRVAICAACHPIFTGQEKLVDTEGLVQKFQKRQKISEKLKETRSDEKQETRKQTGGKEERPKTLKEMLAYAKKHPTL